MLGQCWAVMKAVRAVHAAGQVEEVLLEVIAQQGGREPQQAQQYLDDLAAAGRYQRDVWF